MELGKIKKISKSENGYPKQIREIPKAPEVLYYIGKLEDSERRLAMVGTRRFSSYGRQASEYFAAAVAERGITIVSGLAPGIDTFCHQAAVSAGKRTIAVLGTGLDMESFYPKENIGLARDILKNNGCLISELPPKTKGSRFTFPDRNRIISGLSEAVLVIEAPIKSGAMIPANYAKKQKRKLFALPGSVYFINSQGPNKLIKEGAQLVDKPEDILYEFGLRPQKKGIEAKMPENKRGTDEEKMISTLGQEPLHIDKIISASRMPPAKAIGILSILEIKGRIKNIGDNNYTL